jgi:hypothetical protein
LTRQGRYDRMTDTLCKLTGEAPTNMRDFVKLHAAEFKQRSLDAVGNGVPTIPFVIPQLNQIRGDSS